MPFGPLDQRRRHHVAVAVVVDHLGAWSAIACLKYVMLCYVMFRLERVEGCGAAATRRTHVLSTIVACPDLKAVA